MRKLHPRKLLIYIRKTSIMATLYLANFKKLRGHWIYKKIKKDAVVIDLGANQGAFSRRMQQEFETKCYAIEPNKKLFNSMNDPGITKLNLCVTKSDGKVEFYVSKNSEASSIIPNFESWWGNESVEVVEGLSMSSLIKRLDLNHKTVSVLKMDIEGAEIDLIESLDPETVSNFDQITVEFHDWINKPLHERTINSIKKLIGLGFVEFTDSPDHSWPVEILFVNKNHIKFNSFEKAMLGIYRKIRFLKY